jgi:cytochrome P450
MTYGNIMANYATRMRDGWKDGSTVDISQEMMKLTLGIICKSVLNYDVESEAQKVGRALTTVRNYSKRLQSPIGHVLDKIPILPSPKKAHQAKKELDLLVYGLISDRRQQQDESNSNSDGGKEYNDLLTRILGARDSDVRQVRPDNATSTSSSSSSPTDGKMSDKQVRDEVMTIFIAGHETTANALTWTFYLLSQYPDVERKLIDEIDSFLENRIGHDGQSRIPSAEDIPKLQYTEKVLRESMRIYPPVWTMGRYVETSADLSPMI